MYAPFHKSLADYLVNEARCGRRVCVDVSEGHAALFAKSCEELDAAFRALRPLAPDVAAEKAAGLGILKPLIRHVTVVRHSLLHARLAHTFSEGELSFEDDELATRVRDLAASLPYCLFQAEDDPTLGRLKWQLADLAEALAKATRTSHPRSLASELRADVADMLRWARLNAASFGRFPHAVFFEALNAPPKSAPAKAARAMTADGDLDATGIWVRVDADMPEAFPPLIASLEGHTAEVSSVAFSPDCATVASGSRDKTVRLWSVATGELIWALEGHSGHVNCVAFSPDGVVVASSAEDGTVRLWSVATGAVLKVLEGPWDAECHNTISPDGATVASDPCDGTVLLWSTVTDERLQVLEGQPTFGFRLAISPSGALVASGSVDNTVRLWSTATGGDPLWVLEGHLGPVLSVAISPDGAAVASGSMDETMRLWSVATGKQVKLIEGLYGPVTGVAFSPDGTTIASSANSFVRLWSTVTGEPLKELNGHFGNVWGVAYSPDGAFVASGSDDKTVRLWSAATDVPFKVLEGDGGPFSAMAFSPDGETVASVSQYGTAHLWSAITGELLKVLEGHSGDAYEALSVAGLDAPSRPSPRARLPCNQGFNGWASVELAPGRTSLATLPPGMISFAFANTAVTDLSEGSVSREALLMVFLTRGGVVRFRTRL